MFDSWVGALAPGTTTSDPCCRTCARLFEGLADLDVPTIHFGVGHGRAACARWTRRAATSSASTGGRRWTWRGTWAGRDAACRATWIRPCCGTVGGGGGGRARRAASAPAARRPHLQSGTRRAARRPIPRRLRRLVDLVHERTASGGSPRDGRTHRRAGDGLRDGRAVPTTSSATTRTSAAAARRRREHLQELKDGTPRSATVPPARHDAGAGGGTGRTAERRRGAGRVPRIPGHEALAAVHPGRRRADARGRHRARRRDRDGAALVRDVGGDLRGARPAGRRRGRGARRSRSCGAITTIRRSSRSWRLACGRRWAAHAEQRAGASGRVLRAHACRCERWTTARSGASTATVPDACRYRDGLQETADWWRRQLGLEDATRSGWQSAGRTARSVVGPAGRGRDPRRCADGHVARSSCARRGSSPITSRSCTTWTSRRGRSPRRAGVRFARTEMPNADPEYLEVLAGVVRDAPGGERGRMSGGRVAVVGGGIAGLAAAQRCRMADGARRRHGASRPRTAGGEAVTATSTGRSPGEAGADSFVARKPWAVELCEGARARRRAGLPAANGAFVWTDRGLVAFPEGCAVRDPRRPGRCVPLAGALTSGPTSSRAGPVAWQAKGWDRGNARRAAASSIGRRSDGSGGGATTGRALCRETSIDSPLERRSRSCSSGSRRREASSEARRRRCAPPVAASPSPCS